MYDDYEKSLKEELWSVHKNMKLSMNEIYDMPVYERRNYILIHNDMIKQEEEKMKSGLK